MLTRYLDRRRYIRVPASGPVRWRSGSHEGHCEMLDISPGGAGLRMSARRAGKVGDYLTLEVDLAPNMTWRISSHARVVRRALDDDGMCRIGVEFQPPVNLEPAAETLARALAAARSQANLRPHGP